MRRTLRAPESPYTVSLSAVVEGVSVPPQYWTRVHKLKRPIAKQTEMIASEARICIRSIITFDWIGRLRIPFKSVRARTSIVLLGTAFVGAALQGCVDSQFPLLDNKTIVVDDSLTGHYVVTDSSKKTEAYDVYLKGEAYIFAQESKITFIATLHRWQADVYLAQMRSPANLTDVAHPSPSRYSYMIVKKTDQGVDLNLIQCQTTDDCDVTTPEQLDKLAANAEHNPRGNQLATATKAGELGD